MKTLNVLLFNTTDSQGTDFWRGAGVMAKDPRYKITHVDLTRGWSWLEHVHGDHDIAYIVRPLQAGHQQVVDELRSLKIPVVADWDDTVFNLPLNHPGRYQYTTAATMNLRNIYDMVDFASFSTVGVEEHFRRHVRVPKDTAVFENCLHDLFWIAGEYRGTTNKDLPLLVRGSHCHQPDWVHAKDKWLDVKKSDIVYLGINPFGGRTIPAMPCLGYNKFLPTAPARAFFFPLEPNEFNRGKSNICAIEANVAGVVCLVPDIKDFPEFDKPGWALDVQTHADLHDQGQWQDHWTKTRAAILEHSIAQRDYRVKRLGDFVGKTIVTEV